MIFGPWEALEHGHYRTAVCGQYVVARQNTSLGGRWLADESYAVFRNPTAWLLQDADPNRPYWSTVQEAKDVLDAHLRAAGYHCCDSTEEFEKPRMLT